MQIHYLKTIQPYFSEIKKGTKTFELRYNDRNFKVGDEVYLKEYDTENDRYSGEEIRCEITYVLENFRGNG